MSVNPPTVYTGTVSVSEVRLNPNEAALRLGVPMDTSAAWIAEYDSLVRDSLQMKYCFLEAGVTISPDNITDFGFARFTSKDLAHCLGSCSQVYILATTLGLETDRLIARLSVLSRAKAFIADALASAYAEALADCVSNRLETRIPEGSTLTPRFSPGYGDLSLETQPAVLNILSASKHIGITLGQSLLMTPKKSITAFQGVRNL